MNKMKKIIAAVLATATIATVFVGCGKDSNESTFKAAVEESMNLDSYNMTGNVSISASQPAPEQETDNGESVSNTAVMPIVNIDMNTSAIDKGLTNSTKMNINLLGMGVTEQSVYMKDGITYTSMDGDQTFISNSIEESTGMDISNLQELTKKYNKQIMEKVSASDITFEDTEEGLSAKFSLTNDILKDIFKGIMNDMYPEDSLGEQIRTETISNLKAMGMTDEDIASEDVQSQIDSSVETATKLLNAVTENLNFDKCDVVATIKDGHLANLSYDIELDIKPIMDSLAESMPEMAQSMPENMKILIKADTAVSDINAVTAIDMPEFTEENTMSMDEYISSSVADATQNAQDNTVDGTTEETQVAPVEETPAA